MFGRALERRVPAQGEDPAAGPADVPEQLLHDRRRPDHLHADRVLRPADGVAERARPIAPRVRDQRLAYLDEVVDGAAARLGDELRRVALVMPLEDLQDAARVLHRGILGGRLAVVEPAAVPAVARRLALRRLEALLALAGRAVDLHALVHPAFDAVLALLGIPAGEEAVEVLGVVE